MRNRFLGALSAAGLLLAGIATPAFTEEVVQIDLPAQPLGDALRALGDVTNHNIFFNPKLVEGRSAPALKGKISSNEALTKLLYGSGLTYRFLNENTVVLAAEGRRTADSGEPIAATERDEELRVARAQTGTSAGGMAGETENSAARQKSSATAEAESTLDEIVVTAQKRLSTLLETPISLSVLSAQELERRSLVSGADYLNTVPGVRFDSFGLSTNQLVIRGLGVTLGQSPTAGVYLGDLPLSDALDSSVVDLKLVDMERVEVLRGPQGTLYGSGSLGGAVRQIPALPILNQLTGTLKAGYSLAGESDDAGYNAVGILNLPVVENVLAVRATAYHFDKPGIVDLASTPAIEALSATMQLPVVLEEDTGSQEYSGVRVSSLYQPTEALDATLMLGYQRLHQDGGSSIRISARDYVMSTLATGREFDEQDFRYANLLIAYDLNWATLTSSTSWSRSDTDSSSSLSRVLPWGAHSTSKTDRKGLYQELRLATDLDGPVQFVGGGYYEDVEFAGDGDIIWTSPNLEELEASFGTRDPVLFLQETDDDVKQLAFFGEASYKPAEPWTLRAGVRWFDYERHDASASGSGAFPPGIPLDKAREEDGQIYKLGVDYQPTDNAMLYASWSQGFRLGETKDNSTAVAFPDTCDLDRDNVVDETNFPLLPEFRLTSDRLDNFELGSKLALLGGRVSMNAAVYRIDWQDIPVSLDFDTFGNGDGTCGVWLNGGRAQSEGIELEAVIQATRNLQLSLSGSLSDTEYRDDLLDKQGDPLPFAPKHNASLGVQYGFSVMGRRAFVRSDFSYVGRSGTTQVAPDIVFTNAYHKLGLRAGITFERIDVEVYGTNLTDEDALVGVFNLDRGWRLEPRTYGLDVNFTF